MRVPDSFTLHRQARRARSEEMGRLIDAGIAAVGNWLRRKTRAATPARTRLADPA